MYHMKLRMLRAYVYAWSTCGKTKGNKQKSFRILIMNDVGEHMKKVKIYELSFKRNANV